MTPTNTKSPAAEVLETFLDKAGPAVERLLAIGDETWNALHRAQDIGDRGVAGMPVAERFRLAGTVAEELRLVHPRETAGMELRGAAERAERALSTLERTARMDADEARALAPGPDASLVARLAQVPGERLEATAFALINSGDALGAAARHAALAQQPRGRGLASGLAPKVEAALDAFEPERVKIAAALASELRETNAAREKVRAVATVGARLVPVLTGEWPALKASAEAILAEVSK